MILTLYINTNKPQKSPQIYHLDSGGAPQRPLQEQEVRLLHFTSSFYF